MFKVIIMEIKENYIIAMKEGGELIRINKKDGLTIGDAIFCLEEDIYNGSTEIKKINRNYKNWFIPLAAVAILMVTFIGPLKNMFSPSVNGTYAVLTFDINPSIEFDLDSKGRIVNVKGLNDDGTALQIDSIRGLTVEEGAAKLREILTNENYLGNGNSVLVGFSFINGDDIKYEEMVQNAVKVTFTGTNVAYVKGNEESLAMANEQGVSIGKYEAISMLDEDGIEEAFENLSTQELLNLLKANNSNVFLNEDALDELQDELEDRLEKDEEEKEDDKDIDDSNDEDDSEDDNDNEDEADNEKDDNDIEDDD